MTPDEVLCEENRLCIANLSRAAICLARTLVPTHFSARLKAAGVLVVNAGIKERYAKERQAVEQEVGACVRGAWGEEVVD